MKQATIALLFAIVSATTATGEEMLTFVTVGDPGNPADQLPRYPTGNVAYAFRIQKYETTNQEWVTFLNAVDPLGANAKGLARFVEVAYTRTMAAGYGHKYSVLPGKELFPVEEVDELSAMRFVNWLHGGITESGVYNMAASEPGKTKSAAALYWIPTLNEWYKAAYYQGPNSPQHAFYGTDYSLFPTGGFTVSTSQANFNGSDYGYGEGLVPVGSFPASPSHYGTFDQGGNIAEMTYWNGSFGPCGGSSKDSRGPMASTGVFENHSNPGLRIAASATQPTLVVPSLQIESVIKLSWLSTTTNHYRIQSSTDMISWANEDILLQGTGNQMTSFQSITDTRKYFRVQILP